MQAQSQEGTRQGAENILNQPPPKERALLPQRDRWANTEEDTPGVLRCGIKALVRPVSAAVLHSQLALADWAGEAARPHTSIHCQLSAQTRDAPA